MATRKSLDDSYSIIAALLHDLSLCGIGFDRVSERNTLKQVRARMQLEGESFLTKTLPRLGKALDRALTGIPLDATKLRWKAKPGSKLPMFMGELFERVFHQNGTVLPYPCVQTVRHMRTLLYLFYKYELPYSDEQEQAVIASFVETERALQEVVTPRLREIEDAATRLSDSGLHNYQTRCRRYRRKDGDYVYRNSLRPVSLLTASDKTQELGYLVLRARHLLSEVFLQFDPTDIVPRHGPGAVATKQQLWEKFRWTNVSRTITDYYPLDAYYRASIGHVCDTMDQLGAIDDKSLPARVVLVPKDSRGPRLISCEPVDFQWIQQGLKDALVERLESHPLSRYGIHFTLQQSNQLGALLGSKHGKYATLDLKEASDRISVALVRLLFPEYLVKALMACRSSSTSLPDGQVLALSKYAPMGSALCFPVLATCVWAILTAGMTDTERYDSGILVYGDDVIVPTTYVGEAIERLESFGLLVNRDKSCTSGLFRESCGTDAFQGVEVTPVRFRTVWSWSRSADVYSSWIAYANSMYDRSYYTTYNLIAGWLESVYGPIPDDGLGLTCPSLRVATKASELRSRTNIHLQKREYYVRDVTSPTVHKELDGWSMLLRYFTESAKTSWGSSLDQGFARDIPYKPFSVRSYTRPRTSKLVRGWR